MEGGEKWRKCKQRSKLRYFMLDLHRQWHQSPLGPISLIHTSNYWQAKCYGTCRHARQILPCLYLRENRACWHLHTSLALFCSVKSQRRNYFSLHSTFTGRMSEREQSICRRTPYSAILCHYLPVHSTSDVRTVFLNSQTWTQNKRFYHKHLHWKCNEIIDQFYNSRNNRPRST